MEGKRSPIDREKARLRKHIEELFKYQEGSLPWGKAAEELRKADHYRISKTVYISIHPTLHQVRVNALEDGKRVIVPTPKLKKGFRILNPSEIPVAKRNLAVSASAVSSWGRSLPYKKAIEASIDLIISEALAVDIKGSHLGDGSGNIDIQFAILRSLNWIKGSALMIVIVQDFQILPYVPRDSHDLCAHMIVTPTQTLKTNCRRFPETGIIWKKLDRKQIRRSEALFRLRKTLSHHSRK